ncbi:Protein STPG4 [Acropora cervicornis]|uniref:Protein STPG4 n=1 Tax=Acropora cervicornis TaxID=6130 RepID=A0AAD9PQT3_ACRCE|nr:Protein STPG4 [Acropora cervicornis]
MAYLRLQGSSKGPLFIDSTGQPLTRVHSSSFLQSTMAAAGIPGQFSGHSFHIGTATTAAQPGIPDHLIKTMGKWTRRRSKSPYLYEEPLSDREGWWRSTLKDTPVPGTYDLKNFVQDLQFNPISKTYGFKNTGRKKNADPSRRGSYLMPGLYKHFRCVDQLEKQQISYNFKACDRYHTPTALVGYIDKEFANSQISPSTYYSGYEYVPKLPSKHPAFKSQEHRFPTIYFKPKEGPPPGQYKLSKDPILPKGPNITSPFKSKTPRFAQPHVLPLETRVNKSLNNAPVRLQRILMILQRYHFVIKYKWGLPLHLADTLSPAALPKLVTAQVADFHTTKHQLHEETSKDVTLATLHKVLVHGWPTERKTPGPGTYCKTYQTPMPHTIKNMARNYGLFFTSGTYGDY